MRKNAMKAGIGLMLAGMIVMPLCASAQEEAKAHPLAAQVETAVKEEVDLRSRFGKLMVLQI